MNLPDDYFCLSCAHCRLLKPTGSQCLVGVKVRPKASGECKKWKRAPGGQERRTA